MSRPDVPLPNSRNWRDIPQQVKPRAMSTEGRRRFAWGVAKTSAAVVALGAAGWGGLELTDALRGDATAITSATQTPPVRDVLLSTDGVLDHHWLVATLQLPKQATLMDLDLYRLRSRLLASGQVQTATLTRSFPTTLAVHLSERPPVARLMAQVGQSEPKTYLIARDGVVFEGVGFEPALVDSLPWLKGLKLERQGEGFAPLAGMEPVAELLGKAKLEAEHLYRTWQIVSLERLATDGEIVVHATGIDTIRFSVTEDYFRQLARLDALIDATRAKTDQPLREVNLAIGAQVPVAFVDPALAPVPPSPLKLPGKKKS